jgi:hypothetical protein
MSAGQSNEQSLQFRAQDAHWLGEGLIWGTFSVLCGWHVPTLIVRHRDQSTLPVYAEAMMGRAPPTATVPSAPIISTSRSAQSTSSRRRSGQSFTNNSRPRSGQFLPTMNRIPLMGNNGNTLEGCYFVKEAGLLRGWYWKERWLSLKGAVLTIHCRKTKVSVHFSLSHKLNH